MRNKKLLLILALASFLRLFWLNKVPISLNWDEISMGYSAYSLLHTGSDEWGMKWPLFFRSYGEWKSPSYVYLMMPFIQLFGLNAWGVRLPSALAGIISVYLIYLIGKKLYSDKVGLWSAFLLAVTPWHLMLSRPAFEANLALTFLLTGLYFFISNHYFFSAIFLGLGPHTYNSSKLTVPLIALYLLYSYRRRVSWKQIAVFLTVLAVFATPILYNMATGVSLKRFYQVGLTTELDKVNEFIAYRSTISPPSLARIIFNRYTYSLYHATDNLLSYFDPAFLLANGGPHNQYRIPQNGILFIAEFIFIVVGTIWLIKTKGLSRLPLFLIIFGLLPAAITKGDHHVLRSLLTLPGWIVLGAIGAVNITNSWRKPLQYLLAAQAIFFVIAYFFWYPKVTASDWQYGYQQAIEYFNTHRDQYDQVVMTKWYGEPQLFVAFYSKWDPTYFKQLNIPLLRYETEGRAWLDQLEPYSVGPWTFKYLNWNIEAKSPRTLYIGKWDDFWPDSHIVKTINFPSGKPAFILVEP